MSTRKSSEGAILLSKFTSGTVTNDAELLERKGIKSPVLSRMYAVATTRNNKTQIYFRNEHALEKFKAKTQEPYSLRFINEPIGKKGKGLR